MNLAQRLLSVACVCGLACGLVAGPALRAQDKPEAAAAKNAPPKIQVAILLDTSGSMQGLINQAKTQIWKIVNELATAKRDGQTPDLEVALYEYGKSTLSKDSGYLRKIVPLSNDLDKISEELFALSTNGGEEWCGTVIAAATKELEWTAGGKDLKLIYVCGNEPFTQGPVDYKEACAAAIAKGITVSTIFCGPEQEGIRTGWQAGAQLADGSFLNIDQNRVVAAVKTPFDEKLAKLGNDVNRTYVGFGAKRAREDAAKRQEAQDKNAAAAAPAAAAERAAFKGSAQYSNAAWDLLDAVKAGRVKLQDVKEEDLPEEMKKLKPEERQAYLDKKAAEREKIQGEIKELTEQRRKFIADHEKKQAEATGGANTLDAALLQSIRSQAEKKQFRFANPTEKNEKTGTEKK